MAMLVSGRVNKNTFCFLWGPIKSVVPPLALLRCPAGSDRNDRDRKLGDNSPTYPGRFYQPTFIGVIVH